jgi:hypothetical protein
MGGMTPEERARELVLLLLGEGYPKSEEIAAKTIREALAEQREKDARIARAHNKHCHGFGHSDCAEAISEAISSQDKEAKA